MSVKSVIIESPKDNYQLGELIFSSDSYQMFVCIQMKTGRKCLLQVALEAKHNGILDRMAYYLRELKRQSDELEEKYAKVKKNADDFLNYHLGFPKLIDSFVSAVQENRRINILGFSNVDDPLKMMPLINITERDHLRVDLRTSAWIMGKILKLLVFAHELGISVGKVDISNILIEQNQHYVVIFDWSTAVMHPAEKVPDDIAKTEISQAAQAVITILGGDFKHRFIPNTEEPEKIFHQYTNYLFSLADGEFFDARTAHMCFYKLIDSLWKRAFYPFTAYEM